MDGRIRAREVRVIGADGETKGVMGLRDAILAASRLGLNLVEIAPNANPPVCRIVDFGKFRYEQAKKEKDARKHQHANKLKELDFHVNIGVHDYQIKLNHAVEFLEKGCKVKISVTFRGREMAHQELGIALMKRFIQDCAPYGTADSSPRMLGRRLNVMFTPVLSSKKGKTVPASLGSSSPPKSSAPQKATDGATAPSSDSKSSDSPVSPQPADYQPA